MGFLLLVLTSEEGNPIQLSACEIILRRIRRVTQVKINTLVKLKTVNMYIRNTERFVFFLILYNMPGLVRQDESMFYLLCLTLPRVFGVGFFPINSVALVIVRIFCIFSFLSVGLLERKSDTCSEWVSPKCQTLLY